MTIFTSGVYLKHTQMRILLRSHWAEMWQVILENIDQVYPLHALNPRFQLGRKNADVISKNINGYKMFWGHFKKKSSALICSFMLMNLHFE